MRLSMRDAEGDAEFLRDVLRFLHHAAASARVSANWQMSTSVAWVSAEIGLNDRLPHAFSQISERISVQHHGFQPGLDEDVVQFPDARGLLAVEFADREAVALDMVDDARRGRRRRRIDHAADQAFRVDMPGQDAGGIEAFQLVVVVLAAEPLEVPPGQAVLHRQHDGVGAEQCSMSRTT